MLPKALLACTAATAVFLTTQSQAALVAYWNMNEASGNIADSSGNGLTGTAAGQAGNLTYAQSTVTAGTYGALTIDASTAASFGSSINFTRDLTTTANSGRFDLGSPAVIEGLAEAGPTSGTFTIMAWTNQVGLASNSKMRVFSTGPTGGYGFGMANVDRVAFTTFGNTDFISTGTTAPNSTWHHIALTWNAGVVSMYINGNLTNTITNSTGFTDDTFANFVIGANGGTAGGEAFNGRIDELKIFNTAMTVDEIRAAAITAVPEPSIALLGGLGLLGLLRRRR